MVKRGPRSRADKIESSVMTMLNKPTNMQGGLTFDELQTSLATLPKEERVGSPNTLSDALKRLSRKGLIERDISTRRYRVPEGMPKALTDELRRRSLTSRISESQEFSVLYDLRHERGTMHGFVDKFSEGRGVNALTWEAPHLFDSLLGHITRGILDLAKGNGLFDEAYFEGKRDPHDLTDKQLEDVWAKLLLHHRKMILTYEVDTENLLAFLKSSSGKDFLKKACKEYPRSEVFHETLETRLYLDNPALHGTRIIMHIKRQVVEPQRQRSARMEAS
jgi:hypothetical protein